MFQKKQSLIVFQEEFKEDENKYQINAMYQGKSAGYAIYQIREDGDIDFTWLETNKDYQRKGIASKLVDYLCEKAISNSNSLIINVVDEEVLNGFYLNWFIKRVNPEDKYDVNDIKDYFYDAVPTDGMYFNENHPTLVLTSENLKWKPTKDAEISSEDEYSYFKK